jgi:hypothetical protein
MELWAELREVEERSRRARVNGGEKESKDKRLKDWYGKI